MNPYAISLSHPETDPVLSRSLSHAETDPMLEMSLTPAAKPAAKAKAKTARVKKGKV
jgi:hypothetical protein